MTRTLIFVHLLAVLFFASCISHHQGITLAKFKYNNKNKNRFIVNRVPEYGDGNADGCIIERQVELILNTNNESELEGIVRDAESGELLNGATISICFKGNQGTSSLSSSPQGIFYLTKKLPIISIKVSFIGYRTLEIDFNGKSII